MKINLEELKNRHLKTQELMKRNNIDGIIILQDIDLFYYTNSMQVTAAYLPAEGDILVFYRRVKEKILDDSPLELIQIKSYKEIFQAIKDNKYVIPATLGFEFDVLPVSVFNRVMRYFPDTKPVDVSSIIKEVRMIKSEYELKQMRKAGKLTTEVFNSFNSIIKAGMTELDVAKEIEYLYRQNSHLGPTRMRGFNQELFYGHVLSGESSLKLASFDMPLGGEGSHASFSTGASNKKIKENETIVIDYVSNYNGYHVDTTRTLVIGSLPDKLEKRYSDLQKVYIEITKLLKPGAICEDIYKDISVLVNDLGLSDNFMGYNGNKVNFIGHGIGIEVDEFPVVAPRFNMKIEKNMTIAFEPKMFFPPYGAIGIEDTFLINDDSCEILVDLSTDICRLK